MLSVLIGALGSLFAINVVGWRVINPLDNSSLSGDPATTMSNAFFDRPILNSPYPYPIRHWELDDTGQPTQEIIETRRGAKFVTPAMFWALLASGQINMRRVDGWQTLSAKPIDQPIDLAV